MIAMQKKRDGIREKEGGNGLDERVTIQQSQKLFQLTYNGTVGTYCKYLQANLVFLLLTQIVPSCFLRLLKVYQGFPSTFV